MANTFTDLIPDVHIAMDQVSRELTGYIPAVTRDMQATRAAVGQAIRYSQSQATSGVNISPAMTVPEPADKTVGSDSFSISKARAYPFGYTGEERQSIQTGQGWSTVQADEIAQAIRGLINEVEADIAAAAAIAASRAVGTAGTTPFNGGDSEPVALALKVLKDNGAPLQDLQMVMNTTAGAKLTTALGFNANRPQVENVNQQGVLATLHNMALRETGQAISHTAGDAANATTDNSGYSIGDTQIALAAAGTGAILEGDAISFAGDSNVYMVAEGGGVADVSAGGTVTIQSPGLRVAIPTAATDITVASDYEANVAFARQAIHLAARAPALPDGGDAATDSRIFTDPRSGLAVEIREYKGYRKTRLEAALAWGVGVPQKRHTAMVLG